MLEPTIEEIKYFYEEGYLNSSGMKYYISKITEEK